jgi:8-oxo-dGTP pyrophosphatase MutT (NUDIX family)
MGRTAKRSKDNTLTRVQYGALPYRFTDAAHAEVLLVTSRETRRWIIPKGWPKRHQSPWRLAAREAKEEAGVVGKVSRESIGSYSYDKRLGSGNSVLCEVHVYALKVERHRKNWLEKGQREVAWLSPSKAAAAVEEPALASMIRSLSKRRRVDP